MLTVTRNRIFDRKGNVFAALAAKFNDWIIRRSMRKDMGKFKIHLEDSLGYLPKDDEIIKHGQIRNMPDGSNLFFWKGRYLFEWRL